MIHGRVLIVAESGDLTEKLSAALWSEGFQVDQILAADLASRAQNFQVPDVLLADVSLGLRKLSLAGLQFAAEDGKQPTTMVFGDTEDTDALEACARAGYDYLMPPFLPSLLRARLSPCRERCPIRLAAQETAETAELQDFERQLSIAHRIQAGFLPPQLPAMPGWQLATRFSPAKEVSGDFYDAFELINCGRFGLLVADVCDKGVPAALFMALIRTLLRHTAEHTDEMRRAPLDDLSAAVDTAVDEARQSGVLVPALQDAAGPLVQAVAGTNRYLARNHLREGYFATVFFGLLDPVSGSFLYINGGHNPPVLTRADGGRTLIQPTGPAVGMLADSEFTLGHEVLGPGDSLFVYTDGVTDARSSGGEFFGMDRLLALLAGQHPTTTAEELMALVDARLKEHIGSAGQYDDITMMALRNVLPAS